jgi:hypothetical protein
MIRYVRSLSWIEAPELSLQEGSNLAHFAKLHLTICFRCNPSYVHANLIGGSQLQFHSNQKLPPGGSGGSAIGESGGAMSAAGLLRYYDPALVAAAAEIGLLCFCAQGVTKHHMTKRRRQSGSGFLTENQRAHLQLHRRAASFARLRWFNFHHEDAK